MMTPHANALHSFARRLSLLLMLRGALQWSTVWLFVWGVLVLAARFAGSMRGDWLWFGVLGFAPLAVAAAVREQRRLPALAAVRANYDRLGQCGGILMAEEAGDTAQWQNQLPAARVPALRWKSGRSAGLFSLSLVFVAVTLLLPERFTALANQRPLEIGQLVDQLNAEVQTLHEEKILEETKANDLKQQLARLKEDASANDPNKTWEALDHIKESNSDVSRQAAEEALAKLASLTQSELLASALQQAAEDGGLAQATATDAAQDLAAMLRAAKLEEGLLKGEIPPELLSNLDGLNKEQMANLLKSLQFNKDALGKTVVKLANLKLINPALLSQCKNAGQCQNPNALAMYLSQCTNGCKNACDLAMCYGRGGVNRGRGDAPMTWKDESSEQGAKFKEEALPQSSQLSDAQMIGVSRAAPELSDENLAAGHGALASASGGGGSANAQAILPRHRQAVQRFFNRDEAN